MDDQDEVFGFLLVDFYSALAFFSAVEPLRVANRLAGRTLYRWTVVTPGGEPAEASNGMRLMADQSLSAFAAEAGRLGRAANLVVVAGFEPEIMGEGVLSPALQGMARRGVRLGAIDTGVFLLARAGLVGKGPVTLHWEAEAAFREAFPDIGLSDELYETGERLFTCAGGAAALDMMLDRIADSHGRDLALAVSEQFILDRIRRSSDHQRLSLSVRLKTANPHVLQSAQLMEAHLDEPLAIADIAKKAGVTPRQLERLFQGALGVSPGKHYAHLRLERARQLLRQTDLSVVEIALASGFSSASALSRRYREAFGMPPRADRKEPPRETRA